MTVGDQARAASEEREQFWCPFPRSFYAPDSPCHYTDDFHIGENDPAIQRSRDWRPDEGNGLPWMWIGLGLVAVYFAIRGMEAYAAVKNAS